MATANHAVRPKKSQRPRRLGDAAVEETAWGEDFCSVSTLEFLLRSTGANKYARMSPHFIVQSPSPIGHASGSNVRGDLSPANITYNYFSANFPNQRTSKSEAAKARRPPREEAAPIRFTSRSQTCLFGLDPFCVCISSPKTPVHPWRHRSRAAGCCDYSHPPTKSWLLPRNPGG